MTKTVTSSSSDAALGSGVVVRRRGVPFLHFPSFLDEDEQRGLARAVEERHRAHAPDDDDSFSDVRLASSTSSVRLNAGVDGRCGGDLGRTLPSAVDLARRVLRRVLAINDDDDVALVDAQRAAASLLGEPSSSSSSSSSSSPPPLTGTCLLYGPRARMAAHHDSPTQRRRGGGGGRGDGDDDHDKRREEWLVMFTVGNDVLFRRNDDVLALRSGDAVVMDSVAVLHGVEGIRRTPLSVIDDDDCATSERADVARARGLPEGCRLGVLLWRGRDDDDDDHDRRRSAEEEAKDASLLEGVSDLFS